MQSRESGVISSARVGPRRSKGQVDGPRRYSHLWNVAFGVPDYLAYPAGMLAVAPIALRALGIDRYGVWTVATSLLLVVRTAIGIHFLLGAAMAAIGWCFVPWVAHLLVAAHPSLISDCVWSRRLASFLILMRSLMMLVSIPLLMHRYGLNGMAMSRLLYGPMMLLVYLPSYLLLRATVSQGWRDNTRSL
jgi:hypothetical protein